MAVERYGLLGAGYRFNDNPFRRRVFKVCLQLVHDEDLESQELSLVHNSMKT